MHAETVTGTTQPVKNVTVTLQALRRQYVIVKPLDAAVRLTPGERRAGSVSLVHITWRLGILLVVPSASALGLHQLASLQAF